MNVAVDCIRPFIWTVKNKTTCLWTNITGEEPPWRQQMPFVVSITFHAINTHPGKWNWLFLSYSHRLVELLPSVRIPRYWGIATKCLFYAKASSDPFVYCLLRQQYRKVLVSIISRVVGKDHYLLSVTSASSTFDTTDDSCLARITWAWCGHF